MTTNYAERPYIIPNGHKLYQTAVKYTNIFPSKALQNITKIGIFGTMIERRTTERRTSEHRTTGRRNLQHQTTEHLVPTDLC
jgi:hypothetical protein